MDSRFGDNDPWGNVGAGMPGTSVDPAQPRRGNPAPGAVSAMSRPSTQAAQPPARSATTEPARRSSTTVAEVAQSDGDGVLSRRAAVVGIIAGDGVQIGVLLDAEAPLSVMIDPLLGVVNGRLLELGVAPLKPEGRGRWALCLVDGTALRPTLSLTEHDVYDGDRLWLRFLEDPEHRTPIIEHISTAVSVNLGKRFAAMDPVVAVQTGAALLAACVVLAAGLLGWWRYGHDTWLAAIYGAVVAVLVFATVGLVLARSKTVANQRVGDVLLLSGLLMLAVTAAAAVPGPLGAPNAALGFGVAGVIALLALRFTGRRLEIYAAIITVSVAVAVAGALRMIAMAGAVTLVTSVLLACVMAYHGGPSLSRWLAGIRLPVFPSATSRWVFETRPDLPTTVTRSPGEPAALEGPESVREVVLRSERARALFTGLLAGSGILVVECTAWLTDPCTDQAWLPVLLAGLVAGFLLLRARSFVDRWQSIILTVTAASVVAGVVVRSVAISATVGALAVGTTVMLVLPAAGLLAAAVVPHTTYSPMVRKFVEWIEYLCLMPIFPLALWLMNVYAAIRNR